MARIRWVVLLKEVAAFSATAARVDLGHVPMAGSGSSRKRGGRRVLAPKPVGKVPRLSGNVGQSNHAVADEIAGHEAERLPWAGEERRAVTEHEGAEIESILINKTEVGQALRQAWPGDVNLPDDPSLELA
jgi:hypothetical protein